MNAADTALTSGFDDLISFAGDTVTFRGVSVSAVIDWLPFAEKPENNLPDFDDRATSRFEIKRGALASQPLVGEIVTTDGPIYHRIQKVTFNGYAWLLDCEVTI